MSCIQNEMILETIYEELMEELTLTETLPMYSENEIQDICKQRFEDMCQQVTSSSFLLTPLIYIQNDRIPFPRII